LGVDAAQRPADIGFVAALVVRIMRQFNAIWPETHIPMDTIISGLILAGFASVVLLVAGTWTQLDIAKQRRKNEGSVRSGHDDKAA
jgi:hypothetical protein